MDDEMQALEIGDFEIERRLDAFARARLTPDPVAVARARARVMREARLQFEAARTVAHVVPALSVTPRRSTPRRLVMPLLAASVWLGIAVGSVAASQAGGALYSARLWVENATLPTNGGDRAAAEVVRLDARLGDAMTAATRGDSAAVAAALEAYRQIADETIAASAGHDELEDLVAAALDRHRGVLTAVAASLDGRGATTATAAVETAIQRAIEHNAAVVAAFASNGGGRPSGSGGGATGGAGAGDEGSAAGTGGGQGTTGGGAGGGSANQAPGAGATGGGSGATGGGSGGNAGATDNDDANAGSDGIGNTGNGQEGENRPPKAPQPTPPEDGSSHGGPGENE